MTQFHMILSSFCRNTHYVVYETAYPYSKKPTVNIYIYLFIRLINLCIQQWIRHKMYSKPILLERSKGMQDLPVPVSQ